MMTKQEYKKWYETHQEKNLTDFFTYLKFPSISAQPAHKKALLDCASWVETYLQGLGFSTQRWEGKGHPVIFASRIVDDSAPTILFYGHYDVQPPEPYELWVSEPFEPTIREGRIYARGAEDNKGQNFYTMLAIKAFLENNPEAKLNFKFIMEGEEEMGSALLSELLPTKEKEIRADYLLIVDCGMNSSEKPGLEIGCRGIMTMEIHLKNTDTDLHSGSYGGIVLNPNRVLVELLAPVIDQDGHITIPGMYDDIKPLSREEIDQVNTEFNEQECINEIGGCAFHREKGYSIREANYFRPTFEINGIWGGYTGDGFKTVLPKEAHAKISCRLVPDQKPEKIYKLVCDYFQKRVPKGFELKFEFHGGGPAAWGSPNSKPTQVLKEAYQEVFGSCSIIYGGGSVPITALIEKHSKAEFVLPGVGLACDRIHAPNENFGLNQLEWGFLIITKSLELFAQN